MKAYDNIKKLIEKRIFARLLESYIPEISAFATIAGLDVQRTGDIEYEISEGGERRKKRSLDDSQIEDDSKNTFRKFLDFASFDYEKKDGSKVSYKLYSISRKRGYTYHSINIISCGTNKKLSVVSRREKDGNKIITLSAQILGEKDCSDLNLRISKEDEFSFVTSLTDSKKDNEKEVRVVFIEKEDYVEAGLLEKFEPRKAKGEAIISSNDNSNMSSDEAKTKAIALMSQPRVQGIINHCVNRVNESFHDAFVFWGLFSSFKQIYGIKCIDDPLIASLVEKAKVDECSLPEKKEKELKIHNQEDGLFI